MTKKRTRTESFEVLLEIVDENFIRPPRDSQRNSILNRALREFEYDLEALNRLAGRFVCGKPRKFFSEDRTQVVLADVDIMEDWQLPVMNQMVKAVTENPGDILEIGFGHGISSRMIQKRNVRSHIIVECNDSVVERFNRWRAECKDKRIELVHGLWQETVGSLGLFDGILFHTYPLNEEEYIKYVHQGITFAEHFFATAAQHLKKGGIFTYFSNEIDSLSREHQRSLFRHFSHISTSIINLEIPESVEDSWWADSMVIVKAYK
ncbi:MAG: class I SAM-dependent methyltransferase [Pyrinomonadaceae bacterium]|nr:class I SAM-dependent methyltransferase [Pyrinomonadaceae bacterium]